MNSFDLIGLVAKEYIREHMRNSETEDGVARFLIDRLTGEQVAAICKAIEKDSELISKIEIKIPRALVEGQNLPEFMLTDEKTTYWRNAPVNKSAILMANTTDDQNVSLGDITKIGAYELKNQVKIWVEVASIGLPLSDYQKSIWEQALRGVLGAHGCSLSEFSEYNTKVRTKIDSEGVPVIDALGWALPALRIPRDSKYFEKIPEKKRENAEEWKKAFIEAYTKRACYLVKQYPNRQIIEKSELEETYQKVKPELSNELQEAVEKFIREESYWSDAASKLAEFEWEKDNVRLLFEGLDNKKPKMNFAEKTLQLFEDEFPDELTEDEKNYLERLSERIKKQKTIVAEDEDREFFESHWKSLDTEKPLKAEWDRFIYGKPIECTDFLVGLVEAVDRLFAQTEYVGNNIKLKIRTQKTQSKKAWLDLNTDIGYFFCCSYRGLEKLTKDNVIWETNRLFQYDEFFQEIRKEGGKRNHSTAKAAIQIVFYIELLEDNDKKAQVKLIWQGNPSEIGMELYNDLQRLSGYPFSYSSVSLNPVNVKGKLQDVSLRDVGTLQAVDDKNRGSLVGDYSKSTDLEKVFLTNLEHALQERRISSHGYEVLKNAWERFAEKYRQAIRDWLAVGINSESLLEQCALYDQLLRALHIHANSDLNRVNLWQPVLKIGNVEVLGDQNNDPMTIVTPWHPMRMAAKAVKARQLAGLINYLLTEREVDFGDRRLFFSELKEDILNAYYPEVTVGYKGNEPVLLSISDTVNDYTLMESPVREEVGTQIHDDPKEASERLLDIVERYLKLQPHEKSNLSLILYNCDSSRLPETIVNSLASVHEEDEDLRCQVILRHRDTNKLNEMYMRLVENTDFDADSFVASELTRDFMARLRVGVLAHGQIELDSKEGKPSDIVFLHNVIARQAKIEWEEVNPGNYPDLLNHYPARWARKRPATKDELKSTVYLTCPSQPSVGWAYLQSIYAIVNGKAVKPDTHFLPARQISFQNELAMKIFEEAHQLGEWVVNYDELLDRKQLKNLGVKVIKYQHNKSWGSNLLVSSDSNLKLLTILVKRRLSSLNLGLSESELEQLANRFIDEANAISGDIVLRASKNGKFAGELVGVVLSKIILQSEMGREQPVAWFFLDDYASWFGQKEEQIADILALAPRNVDNELRLQVLLSEAKYVEDKNNESNAKNISSKQLRDTFTRVHNALFGNPGRLDRDLWLAKLSDLLIEGIELPSGTEITIEKFRDGIRSGEIPIELRGYSHVFVSYDPEKLTDGERHLVPKTENCYQEVYPRQLVRDLVISYHKGESVLPLREKLDAEKPWETTTPRRPAASVQFIVPSVGYSIKEGSTVKQEKGTKETELMREAPKSSDESQEVFSLITEHTRESEKEVAATSEIAWMNPKLAKWIEEHTRGSDQETTDQAWVNQTINELRKALINYGLQAKVNGHRLTPNALVIRFQGSDRLSVEDVEKYRSKLLTTYALNVINVAAQPGEVVISIARPKRQSISLADVWKARKVQNHPSGINMSFVIGVKELDGELLYLNLNGEFENCAHHAPHTLIAGATGSGKSVLLQNLILDICMTNSKDLARIYLIDPKYVDYQHLKVLPHLVEGIIDDRNRAMQILEYLVNEMDERYRKFKDYNATNLFEYNFKVADHEKLPVIFMIHDEFADWMQIDEYKQAITSTVQRLGIKARAAGIHLIFAAQRPDANVFPPQLRDNLGNRLILRVESVGTSEIALGAKGAEKLLGKGHLIARLQGESSLIYAQVPFIDKDTVQNLFEYLQYS